MEAIDKETRLGPPTIEDKIKELLSAREGKLPIYDPHGATHLFCGAVDLNVMGDMGICAMTNHIGVPVLIFTLVDRHGKENGHTAKLYVEKLPTYHRLSIRLD